MLIRHRNALLLGIVIALGTALASTSRAEEKKGDAAANKKPYPMTTCVVSGEKLGEMGEPHIITYEGREIRFCCKNCEKDFKKDPKKYLKKLDDAQKEKDAKSKDPAK